MGFYFKNQRDRINEEGGGGPETFSNTEVWRFSTQFSTIRVYGFKFSQFLNQILITITFENYYILINQLFSLTELF